MTTDFTLELDPDYRLDAAREFLCGFVPANGGNASDGDRLVLGMCRDRGFEPMAVTLEQRGGRLVCSASADAPIDEVRAQVARILSLDVDPAGWLELGEREPAIGALQQRFAGFRPLLFPTPYEAALWGVLSQRLPMRRAATLRVELARELGAEIDGVAVSPPPAAIVELEAFAGLSAEKVSRLRGVAAAALDRRLDADRLRGLDEVDALAELGELRGVGAWTAAHILYRGAGSVDGLPAGEPRVRRGVELALGLDHTPDAGELEAIAEPWRPYRMWVSILAVRVLAAAGQWSDRSSGPRRTSRRPKSPASRRRPRARARGV